jgi:glycosyltransferase involved in cell wall biosynthesis
MKVLQLTTWYSPRIGGVETHVKRLSEELRRLQLEVEVLTLTETREPHAHSFPGFQIPGIPYGFGLFPHPKAFLEVLGTDADLVHCHAYGWPLAWAAYLTRKLKGTPFVFTTHSDPYSRIFSLNDLTRAFPAGGCDRAIALTEQEKGHLTRLGIHPSKIRVIPNGFDRPVPGPRPIDEPYILCVGRVEFRHKGQDLLLDAFQKSRVSHDLVYVGDGPDLARLRARSRGLSKVRVLGPVDEVAKGAWMSNADLVVVPSRTEPFGIVALEAGSLGRRLVATRVGGLQHIAGSFATMTNPDPRDIARSMLLALSKDPPRVPQNLTHDHSWQLMAKRVLDVFQELTVIH